MMELSEFVIQKPLAERAFLVYPNTLSKRYYLVFVVLIVDYAEH